MKTLIHSCYTNTPGMAAWPIALLRISVGIMFLIACYPKIIAGADWPGRMLGFLKFQADKSYPFYRDALETLVIPNAEVFAYLVAYGELAVGISLVFGIATRLGTGAGLFMVTNFLLAKGGAFWVPSANDPMYILALITLLFSNAGLVLGFDGYRAANKPLQ